MRCIMDGIALSSGMEISFRVSNMKSNIQSIVSVMMVWALVLPGVAGIQQKPINPTTSKNPAPDAQNKKVPSDQQKKKEPQRQGAEAENQPEKGETLIVDTDLVLLDVAVFDQSGKPIENLKPEDFTVYEDKVKQPIDNVSRIDVPLSLGIVIDTSGSMRTKLQTVSDSAQILIKQMKDEDEAFLAQFKAEAELVRDFTRDKRDLEDGLNDLYTGGGTALLDAIIATADHAQEREASAKKLWF